MSEMQSIVINVDRQVLTFCGHSGAKKQYQISSAANGVGEENNSFCTPRGAHTIRAKIGEQADINSVFVGRRQTGEIFHPTMREAFPNRDWILTRIIWLSGCEVGFNRLGDVDTMRRYIYIHGSPDDVEMGVPGSRGCIRMKNHDIVELFDLVNPGDKVEIKE